MRQEAAIVPLLFNAVLETAIRRFKVETWGNIFDKRSQIMACGDDVVIMGRRLKDAEKYLHHWSNKQIGWNQK